jgi:tetratricopeptide (TPR) repeat protein
MPTILFLAANPTDTPRAALDQELREIQDRLRGAELGDRFRIEAEWAVRLDELEGHLLRHRPDLVHFSGHGSAAGEILLADRDDRAVAVPEEALSRLFGALRPVQPNLRCVVLNACFSAAQARGIAGSIDCVVGMTGAVKDSAATAFAGAFYQALGFGESVQSAFDLGCAQLDLTGLAAADVPRLLARDGVVPATVRLDAGAQSGAPAPLFEGPGAAPALGVPHFTGRAAELSALRRMLAAEDAACVVVTGLDGMGKSSLTRQFVTSAEGQALFPAGALWLDGTALPVELSRAAERFGLRDARTPEEAWRGLVRALHDLPALLVVDDVVPASVDLRQLPIPGGRCRTVLTSRFTTLPEDLSVAASALGLDPWDAATSRAYLRAAVPGLAAADAELDALSGVAGGMPLAVRLVARLLLRPGATPEAVRARLSREAIDQLDAVARGADRGITATFRAAFQDLEEAPRKVLVSFAACAPSTRAAVVATVAGVGEDAAAEALADLAERSLSAFTAGAERPWSLHAVLRLFVRDQEGIAAADAAQGAFALAHAQAHRDPADWQALEREAPEVLAALDHLLGAGDGPGAARLLDLSAAYLARRGRDAELLDLCQRLLPLLPRGAALAAVESRLGLSLRNLGRAQEAIEQAEAALALYDELGDAPGQASAHNDLGSCYLMSGRLPEAIDHLQRALSLGESLGDRKGQANALNNLGICYQLMGNLATAADQLRRALALDEALGNLPGQAQLLSNLGVCEEALGDPDQALEQLRRALALDEALGDVQGQAHDLDNLGRHWLWAGDLPAALDHFQRALALAEQLGPLGLELAEAIRLDLEAYYQATGDAAQAEEQGRAASDARRRMGPADAPVTAAPAPTEETGPVPGSEPALSTDPAADTHAGAAGGGDTHAGTAGGDDTHAGAAGGGDTHAGAAGGGEPAPRPGAGDGLTGPRHQSLTATAVGPGIAGAIGGSYRPAPLMSEAYMMTSGRGSRWSLPSASVLLKGPRLAVVPPGHRLLLDVLADPPGTAPLPPKPTGPVITTLPFPPTDGPPRPSPPRPPHGSPHPAPAVPAPREHPGVAVHVTGPAVPPPREHPGVAVHVTGPAVPPPQEHPEVPLHLRVPAVPPPREHPPALHHLGVPAVPPREHPAAPDEVTDPHPGPHPK